MAVRKSKKKCSGCGREVGDYQFYSTNSKLFKDGKMPFCKQCLKDMIDERDIETVYSALRQVDKPFLVDVWQASVASSNDTVGDYFRKLNSLPKFNSLNWKDSIFKTEFVSKDNTAIEVADYSKKPAVYDENAYQAKLNGAVKMTDDLKVKWGKYPDDEILKMEKIYQDMIRANDISTPQHKKELQFYCKLSVLAERALDEGDYVGYEKLFKQLDSLKKSGGFRAVDNKSGAEASGIRTFSQIYEEVERDGYIEPKPIQERQDIVDRTIQHMLNYQLKLYNHGTMQQPPEDTPKLLEEEMIPEEGDVIG